jgi:hypothetical protein
MDSTLLYLYILGIAQISVITLSIILFISPLICFAAYYPHEPAPRIVQLAYPTLQKIPFLLFVNQTVVHSEWYVASISQYAGARGTTAAKILTFATATAGVLQIILSILLWNAPNTNVSNTVNDARLVLLILGGIGSICLGQAESAIPWHYGRREQIILEWATLSETERQQRLNAAITSLEHIASSTFSVVIHPQWNKTAHPIPDTEAVDQGLLTGTLKTSEAIEALHDLQHYLPENGAPEIAPKGYITYRTYQMGSEDISIGGLNELILENDLSEKSLYTTIHIIGALLLMLCTWAAHLIPPFSSTHRILSLILGSVGGGMFLLFSFLQYLSGNYDQSPGIRSLPLCLTTRKPNCLFYYCRCVQTQPTAYRLSKKTLGLIFISIELIAFAAMMYSTGIEALILAVSDN